MPLLKFNLRWDDDINVERDIEILHSQTFHDFHEIIKKSFVFPPTMDAVLYTSDETWRMNQAVSSLVEKNIRGAEALAMKKTPIGALLSEQNQKFVYKTEHKKKWGLQIELISMSADPAEISGLPRCIREEGVSPATFGTQDKEKDGVAEIEEKFDLDKVDPAALFDKLLKDEPKEKGE
jgi:hypothetical protein